MAIIRKYIIMKNKGVPCGVVTLTQNGVKVIGNISGEYYTPGVLGIYTDKLYIFNIDKPDKQFTFECPDIARADCLLARQGAGKLTGVCFGSNCGSGNETDLLIKINQEFRQNDIELIKSTPKEEKISIAPPSLHDEAVPTPIIQQPEELPVMQTKKEEDEPLEFYYSVKQQLDEMFVCYPEVPEMNAAIPGSKWVRIDSDEGPYVMGVISAEGAPVYICYGVPEEEGGVPPTDIKHACELIKTNAGGYWIVYQDATTGETLTKNNP